MNQMPDRDHMEVTRPLLQLNSLREPNSDGSTDPASNSPIVLVQIEQPLGYAIGGGDGARSTRTIPCGDSPELNNFPTGEFAIPSFKCTSTAIIIRKPVFCFNVNEKKLTKFKTCFGKGRTCVLSALMYLNRAKEFSVEQWQILHPYYQHNFMDNVEGVHKMLEIAPTYILFPYAIRDTNRFHFSMGWYFQLVGKSVHWVSNAPRHLKLTFSLTLYRVSDFYLPEAVRRGFSSVLGNGVDTGDEWYFFAETYDIYRGGVDDVQGNWPLYRKLWNTRRPNDVTVDVRNVYHLYLLPVQKPVIGTYLCFLIQRNKQGRSQALEFRINMVHHEYTVDSLSSFKMYKMEVSKVNLKLPTTESMFNRATAAANNQDLSGIRVRANGRPGSCFT